MRIFKNEWVERQILLGVLTVVDRPWTTLICCGALLAASVVSALLWLNVSSDQDKLFSTKVPFFHDYVEFDRQFPENDALYVVIEAKADQPNPPVKRWTAAADAIAASVAKVSPKYIESIDAHVPLDKLGKQGLLFDKAQDLHDNFAGAVRFAELARLWAEKRPKFARVPVGFLLGRTPAERFLAALTINPDPEAATLLNRVAEGWNITLKYPALPIQVGVNVPNLRELEATDPSDMGYYWQADETDPAAQMHPEKARHLLLVRIFPRVDYTTLSSTAEPVEAIRVAVRAAAKDFPEFDVGTTGRPALDADEMATTDADSRTAEIIAAIAVFIGLVVMLRSLWLALAAEIALAVGIGWTFGWATVTLHELNLLSIVFLIALIGIGMDYLVQILARYRTEARRHQRPKAVWFRVFRSVSAPINTACFGAAAAFLVSIFTNFRGAADLGIIAGGGLILCLLCGYTVLPALLTLIPVKVSVDVARRPTGKPAKPLGPLRLILPTLWVCMIAVLSPWAGKAHFDPNLIKLQAPNLESTKLIRKLQTWSSVVMTKDLSMLAQARDAVAQSLVVQDTESVLSAQDNYHWLIEHQKELPAIEWADPPQLAPDDIQSISTKARALADRLAALPPPATSADKAERDNNISNLRAFAVNVVQTDPAIASARLSAWQSAFVAELRSLLEQFSPRPLELSKVPPELRNHLVSRDGTYALYINPKRDMDLWDRVALAKFVKQVEYSVDKVPGHPPVTGIAPNIYYTTREVRGSFIHATIYALIAIVLLVLIDLKSIRHTLLAISVLGLGLPLLVELMGIFDVNWNFANFFGLPILIGAGHEYGVFMIHRYRETLRDGRRVWRFWDVADRALLLCAYITSSSFGFFWAISEHRGLKSLGLVMALGTACIYLSTVMVLRPLLLWRLEKRAAATLPPASPDEPTRAQRI